MDTEQTAGTRAENEHGSYWVPEGLENRPAAKMVLAGKVYEPDTIRFICAHAGDGDVIHAGTFFGDFLPALSAALIPGARLWAFEPNPGSHAAALRTIGLNGLDNVTLTNAAVSDAVEPVLFRTRHPDGRALGGVSHYVEEPGPGVETVESVMLDYAVPSDRRITVLQLDVEGHEARALRGAYHIINRCRPILVLEYFDQEQWIRRTFRGLGYRKAGKVHGNFVYAPDGTDLRL